MDWEGIDITVIVSSDGCDMMLPFPMVRTMTLALRLFAPLHQTCTCSLIELYSHLCSPEQGPCPSFCTARLCAAQSNLVSHGESQMHACFVYLMYLIC